MVVVVVDVVVVNVGFSFYQEQDQGSVNSVHLNSSVLSFL